MKRQPKAGTRVRSYHPVAVFHGDVALGNISYVDMLGTVETDTHGTPVVRRDDGKRERYDMRPWIRVSIHPRS